MNKEEAINHYLELKSCENWIESIDAKFFFEFAETLLHYIKEESIPRALVEEVINKQIEIIRNENEQLYYAENVTDVILEDILQEILTKGEK